MKKMVARKLLLVACAAVYSTGANIPENNEIMPQKNNNELIDNRLYSWCNHLKKTKQHNKLINGDSSRWQHHFKKYLNLADEIEDNNALKDLKRKKRTLTIKKTLQDINDIKELKKQTLLLKRIATKTRHISKNVKKVIKHVRRGFKNQRKKKYLYYGNYFYERCCKTFSSIKYYFKDKINIGLFCKCFYFCSNFFHRLCFNFKRNGFPYPLTMFKITATPLPQKPKFLWFRDIKFTRKRTIPKKKIVRLQITSSKQHGNLTVRSNLDFFSKPEKFYVRNYTKNYFSREEKRKYQTKKNYETKINSGSEKYYKSYWSKENYTKKFYSGSRNFYKNYSTKENKNIYSGAEKYENNWPVRNYSTQFYSPRGRSYENNLFVQNYTAQFYSGTRKNYENNRRIRNYTTQFNSEARKYYGNNWSSGYYTKSVFYGADNYYKNYRSINYDIPNKLRKKYLNSWSGNYTIKEYRNAEEHSQYYKNISTIIPQNII
ncbi:uncharacterized protein LOC142324985 isoform X1 [Lycorma delicatula]|uniref:uncharacterized protein LOC142324985 isoform X1 n=1 Tax=Lycorma delicatula TaxID=130591 RepID=UPI003F5185F8